MFYCFPSHKIDLREIYSWLAFWVVQHVHHGIPEVSCLKSRSFATPFPDHDLQIHSWCRNFSKDLSENDLHCLYRTFDAQIYDIFMDYIIPIYIVSICIYIDLPYLIAKGL